MDMEQNLEGVPNFNTLEEIKKFGRRMWEIIDSRTDKTDLEKNELRLIKTKEINDIIAYITDIIIGEETFDNHNEKIYANYIAEYTVISEIWADKCPEQWEVYKQNRKIFEENFRKKPKQIDKEVEVDSRKGGEAGLVPRTYSMGAQPPPSNLPLDKEHINVEGNKVSNPEICQTDGQMDTTNETIKHPNSSEDESSGNLTKNIENPKKKRKKPEQGFQSELSQYKMSKNALVFIASGTDEMEIIIVTDILARAGVNVTTIGVPDDSLKDSTSGVRIKPDIGINDAKSIGHFDVLVLPGGVKGCKIMVESKEVGEMLKDQESSGRWIAAICVGPTVLKGHGIAYGKTVTSYPAKRKVMEEGGNYKYIEDKVVVDGNIITSRGPATSFDFALMLVEKLIGKQKASEVAKILLLDCDLDYFNT
ncbi:hypothetical protein JTB14_034502 [Gonioctena quinquepunctata]|nr:hypothetical protein JTB14_034502 [Gonioctena quinquepunctata]